MVPADGNCFYRAVMDQLEGPRGDYRAIRAQIVDHIEANKRAFEPFVEDDEPFERYCAKMRRDGAWAGNMEVRPAVRPPAPAPPPNPPQPHAGRCRLSAWCGKSTSASTSRGSRCG